MFIQKDKKENIKSFAIGNKKVIISSTLSIHNLEDNSEVLKSDKSLQEIHFSCPYFYVSDIYGNSFLIKNNEILYLENKFVISILNEEELLVEGFDSTDVYHINNSSSTSLFSQRIFKYSLKGNIIFFKERDKINSYSLSDKIFLWDFDISQFGQWKNFEDQDRNYEVEQFVGVSGSCLYVLLSNFKLIALHIETGELLHQLNLGEIFALEPRNWLRYSSKMHLDEVNSRIIWLTSATLLHIDLANFSAKLIKDFFNVQIENLWRFKCSNYQDLKLLFTAQYGREGGDPDIVGTMNPDTGAIDWQYQIPNTQGLYETPQLANNKLYVRSLDNDLYIFGKQ